MEVTLPITELGVDLRRTPHVLRVPRYMYGSAVRDAAAWIRHALQGRAADAFRHQMMLAYFAGYLWTRATGRGQAVPAARHDVH